LNAVIYMKLPDEAVDVWRPVQAKHVHGEIYAILDQPYDRETETWEFEPGDQVIARVINSDSGPILAAVDRSPD